MQSPFVQRLLVQLEKNQANDMKAFETAIAAASSQAPMSDGERLRAEQLFFALKVIAAVTAGMSPWVAGGPTEIDKDWAVAYYKARKAQEVRPIHFDPEIEKLIQNVTI